MRPILCPLDDSDDARAALVVANELAGLLEAPLVLLNVQPSVTAPGVSAAAAGQERLREAEEDDARALLERVTQEAGVSGAELHTAVGSPAERIVGLAREIDAQLVVLGSRGRGDLSSALLGSVSNSVASHAPCPVVIVPPAAAGRPLRDPAA